tara:strand:- start:1135 stop:2313 length:1179 start_codon:yes stop_codon:yes gene_type:complete
MINFQTVSQEIFLQDYWQKKPLLIKNAMPGFTAGIDADELAGLAMEENIESKLVYETPTQSPQWHLKPGPFVEADFNSWPKTHWTLLVQGLDRIIPEVSHLLEHFNFLPQWRVDDVMISVAAMQGSVGPHYDNYDVFLYQASGQRKWSLTTKNCHEENALPGVDLRIMEDFQVEQEIILNEGDMLYLPPHVGHHGISLTENSIGYSFGYRSYQSQELWDSFADYLSETKDKTHLYNDPNWKDLNATSEIPKSAYLNAKEVMLELLNDEKKLQQWFSRFATQLDQSAVQLLTDPLTCEETSNLLTFIETVKETEQFVRELTSRIAYHFDDKYKIQLFINGETFDHQNACDDLVKIIACHRIVKRKTLMPFLKNTNNQTFLYELWKQQFLIFGE